MIAAPCLHKYGNVSDLILAGHNMNVFNKRKNNNNLLENNAFEDNNNNSSSDMKQQQRPRPPRYPQAKYQSRTLPRNMSPRNMSPNHNSAASGEPVKMNKSSRFSNWVWNRRSQDTMLFTGNAGGAAADTTDEETSSGGGSGDKGTAKLRRNHQRRTKLLIDAFQDSSTGNNSSSHHQCARSVIEHRRKSEDFDKISTTTPSSPHRHIAILHDAADDGDELPPGVVPGSVHRDSTSPGGIGRDRSPKANHRSHQGCFQTSPRIPGATNHHLSPRSVRREMGVHAKRNINGSSGGGGGGGGGSVGGSTSSSSSSPVYEISRMKMFSLKWRRKSTVSSRGSNHGGSSAGDDVVRLKDDDPACLLESNEDLADSGGDSKNDLLFDVWDGRKAMTLPRNFDGELMRY